jgi:hypothetical protein
MNMWWNSGAFLTLTCLMRKLLNQERRKSVSLYTQSSRCSIHNNHYVIKIKRDVITTHFNI